MEDLKSPILTTRYEKSYLTSGCWSPTRPGVFYTTKLDGTLDVWDFFYKQNDPVYSTMVGESGLSSIKVQNEGSLVAVGSVDGSTTLLQVCNSLSEAQNNEKPSITQMFERENRREKNLEIRAMQLKREKRANEPGGKSSGESQTNSVADNGEGEEDESLLEQIEKSFYESMASLKKRGEDEDDGEVVGE
jgi:dynein intermediate chain 2